LHWHTLFILSSLIWQSGAARFTTFSEDEKMSQLEKIQFTMEIIRTVCPVVMVILQIAIITGLVIMGDSLD
tara:strand:+ start:222 stop:434 length:213 start_codon:yes stop_codon:yes gene_type:complete